MAREMPSDSGCIWSKGTVNVRKNMTPNFFFFFWSNKDGFSINSGGKLHLEKILARLRGDHNRAQILTC